MKLIYDSRQEKLPSRIKFAWRMVLGFKITIYTPDGVIEAGYEWLKARGRLEHQRKKAKHIQTTTRKRIVK